MWMNNNNHSRDPPISSGFSTPVDMSPLPSPSPSSIPTTHRTITSLMTARSYTERSVIMQDNIVICGKRRDGERMETSMACIALSLVAPCMLLYGSFLKPLKRRVPRRFGLQLPWDALQISSWILYSGHMVQVVISELFILPVYSLVPIVAIYALLCGTVICSNLVLGFFDAADPELEKNRDPEVRRVKGKNWCLICNSFVYVFR